MLPYIAYMDPMEIDKNKNNGTAGTSVGVVIIHPSRRAISVGNLPGKPRIGSSGIHLIKPFSLVQWRDTVV